MKTLIEKIENELIKIEHQEYDKSSKTLDRATLDETYKLSKTLVYLHKACCLMKGKKMMDTEE